MTRNGGLIAILSMFLCVPAGAAIMECPDPRFEVSSDDQMLARQVCGIAKNIADRLANCHVTLSDARRIRIEILAEMPENCLGLYHCHEEIIQIPVPEILQSRRREDSSLSHVRLKPFFESVLAHELAHAAMDERPCPFESCVIANEFVAYAMQIMSLPDTDIATFEAGLDMETPVTLEWLNPVILYMAPDAFMRRAWIYFRQRPDACGYVDMVMKGRVRMDYEYE